MQFFSISQVFQEILALILFLSWLLLYSFLSVLWNSALCSFILVLRTHCTKVTHGMLTRSVSQLAQKSRRWDLNPAWFLLLILRQLLYSGDHCVCVTLPLAFFSFHLVSWWLFLEAAYHVHGMCVPSGMWLVPPFRLSLYLSHLNIMYGTLLKYGALFYHDSRPLCSIATWYLHVNV